MGAPDAYRFRRAGLPDLAMLRAWIATPEVARWWDSADDPFDAKDLADDRFVPWIVSHAGMPFGYMQDYCVHGWPGHHFSYLPAGTRGIDQIIGVPGMLGRGHGTAFIGQRMRALFAAGAPVIATDPHPDNARAIAVYKKLGFVVAGQRQGTRWGEIIPMVASRPGP